MPNAMEFRHMNENIDKCIPWKNSSKEWELLMQSRTGFLLVDASIKQMITTGYLPYTLRYLVGVFWTKYLHINPFESEIGSQVGFSKYCIDAIGVLQNKYNHHYLTEFNYDTMSSNSKTQFIVFLNSHSFIVYLTINEFQNQI